MSSHSTSKALPKLVQLVKAKKPKLCLEKPLSMEDFGQKHKLLSYPTLAPRNLSLVGGQGAYLLLGSYAKLENALMKWSINELVKRHKFTPVVVPNILYDHIIDKCGFPTRSERSQVYKISANNQESILDDNSIKSSDTHRTHSCMAGTSEFALVSIHISDTIPSDELPKKYCALSRCYRAETSRTSKEKGIYRVHYFNKVEMVALTMPDQSEQMLQEFVDIQKDLYAQLGLHYRVLDMPQDDLGLSASKKYDIEAWMEARQRFGEISSASNCLDYQTSRLNIKYSHMVERDNQLQVDSGHVHSVNGTACSSIRSMIAMIEQNQLEDGTVAIPEPLVSYMDGLRSIPSDKDRKLLGELDLYPEKEVKQ